jgi:hypothetical protein
LRDELEGTIPDGKLRESAIARIDPGLDPDVKLTGEEVIMQRWRDAMAHPPAQGESEAERAKQWQVAGCDANGGPDVVRSFIRRLSDPFYAGNPDPAQLAAAFLSKGCAGAKGLAPDELVESQRWQSPAPQPAPAH